VNVPPFYFNCFKWFSTSSTELARNPNYLIYFPSKPGISPSARLLSVHVEQRRGPLDAFAASPSSRPTTSPLLKKSSMGTQALMLPISSRCSPPCSTSSSRRATCWARSSRSSSASWRPTRSCGRWPADRQACGRGCG